MSPQSSWDTPFMLDGPTLWRQSEFVIILSDICFSDQTLYHNDVKLVEIWMFNDILGHSTHSAVIHSYTLEPLRETLKFCSHWIYTLWTWNIVEAELSLCENTKFDTVTIYIKLFYCLELYCELSFAKVDTAISILTFYYHSLVLSSATICNY